MINVVSLFSGAGGLDNGFEQAGFKTIWANEKDKTITDTFKANFPNTVLDTRSITDIKNEDIPNNFDVLIGGPPCQSWSVSGANRGMGDDRGKLFMEYIRILSDKKPKVFVAENVQGILQKKHKYSFHDICEALKECGYKLSVNLVNASDYGVPQDRKRVFFIGVRSDLNLTFNFPLKLNQIRPNLKDVIWDVKDAAKPLLNSDFEIPNHEYYLCKPSSRYMGSNRVRSWDEQSYTIVAHANSIPQHPIAPKMTKVKRGDFEFKKGYEHLYRRLTVRECARVQTFPDNFKFHYKYLPNGYKMVGNAVPPTLAYHIAKAIKEMVLGDD